MALFSRVYVIVALAIILAGVIFRWRREPERRAYYVGIGVTMAFVVVLVTWALNGMSL